MKSIKFFAVASAVALLSTAGFTSCNQKNGPEDPKTGNYNGEVVKTEFLINISENAVGKTLYMSGTTVQHEQTIASFRGMTDLTLIPLTGDYSTRKGATNITSAGGLTDIPAANLIASSQSKVYDNIAIPIGTDRVLFYGQAPDEANATLDTKKHINGSVIKNNLTAADPSANIKFSLDQITTSLEADSKATALANYLTGIANVSGWDGHTVSALDALHDAFIQMMAGSSASIEAMLNDLYGTLKSYNATHTPDDVVTAIIAKIADGTGSGANVTINAEGPQYVTLTGDLAGYPANLNLPDGAAVIKWGEPTANQFNVRTDGTGSLGIGIAIDRYVYPASLQYYAASTIATATTSKKALYNGTNDWNTILGGYTATQKVNLDTKSVAIETPIEYGVAQLAADVRVKKTGLKDFKEDDYDCSNSLEWTAILIGGQQDVNYVFEHLTTPATPFTVYDNYMNNAGGAAINIPLTGGDGDYYNYSTVNYTLLFSTQDNIKPNDDPDEHTVNVAIELVNKNAAFYGQGGQIIPAGAKFYLVGKLDVSGQTIGTTAQTTGAGAGHPVKYNIFYKDFVTTAHFTIGANSLKSAYNTIPDLRSHDLELGFSVDLAWQTGIVFNVEF